MDPNSSHQLWSKWTITVRPPLTPQVHANHVGQAERVMACMLNPRSWAEVVENTARFMRKAFGTASQMRIRQFAKAYVIEVLTEGVAVHDPALVKHYSDAFAHFFRNGFGPTTQTTVKARLMAGDRQDGTPRDQLLILPTLTVNPGGVRRSVH